MMFCLFAHNFHTQKRENANNLFRKVLKLYSFLRVWVFSLLGRKYMQRSKNTLIAVKCFDNSHALFFKYVKCNALCFFAYFILGKVHPLKLDIDGDNHIQFGSLQGGEKKSKRFHVINKSKKAIDFKMKLDTILESNNVEIQPNPTENITLKPKEKKLVIVNYGPVKRKEKFEGNIFAECEGKSIRLCNVTAACHGVSAKLESDTLSFGKLHCNL